MDTTTQTKNISLINQVVLESMDASNEAAIVKKFIEAAIIILRADFGFSFIKDRKTDQFQLLYKDKRTPYTPQVPRKKGVTTRAFKTKQPLYFTTAQEAGSVRSDAKKFMRGVVVIPVTYKKTNFGTLDICFYETHDFTEEEKSLCAYIGNSAAQALTIHRFYRHLGDLVDRRTEQLKLANTKLQEDKASDDAILASIGEGLIATDREGNIIFANPQAQNMLGWSPKEMIGQPIFTFQKLVDSNGQDVVLEKRPTYQVLQQGKRVTTNDLSYIKKNKQRVPLSLTITPVKLNGQTVGTIQVLRDISQEREIDRVKTELISLASHQLRTPLSAINWYTEVLVKEELGKLNNDQKRYLQQIHHANQKMVELVYDFLNVSRIELGTFSIKLSIINVRELAQSVLREIVPLVSQKKLRVTEKYGRGLEKIEGDRKVIRLILQNLITNAVKYTPEKGKIKVSIGLIQKTKNISHLCIEVSDTGHGIPRKQQSKIFTKLFRGDNVAKLDSEGSGLGLYLVKSFVDFCQGKITFTSKENKGTTFKVLLPVSKGG